MNKANVFCSSSFYMGTGDILHILIIDEVGNPVEIELSTGDDNVAPSAPYATAATNRTETSFTANWMYNENSTGYYLDVAEDIDFTSFVLGFNNKDIGNDISDAVAGLDEATNYYYRVRAYNDYGTSPNSNIVTVGTTNPYGAFYNQYAILSAHVIAPTGWHVPTVIEWNALRVELDPMGSPLVNVAGEAMKEVGTNHWQDANGTNTSGFTGMGAGVRNYLTAAFLSRKIITSFWSGDAPPANTYNLDTTSDVLSYSFTNAPTSGMSVRLIKDNSVDPGTVTDYDGNVYSTVTIGTQVWMAENLKVTHYIDGTSIPNITDDTQWLNDTTGAMCYYNNVAP